MTTARFHLDVLQRAGMVRRPAERAGQVGRPRQLYAVVAAPEAGEGYRQLADVLAGGLAADPDVGPRWAERGPAGDASRAVVRRVEPATGARS